MKRRRSCPAVEPRVSAFAGYRFPPEVMLLAVRWNVRFGLSYRDLEELLGCQKSIRALTREVATVRGCQ